MNDTGHRNDLKEADFEQLVRHHERQMPRALRQLLGPARAQAVVAQQMAVEWDRCQSASFAANFARGCPVDGAREEDYLQSLWVWRDVLMLTGIRFKGGRVDEPFVDILATTASWHQPHQVHALLDAVLARYRVFSPRSVRVLCDVASPPCVLAPWSVEMDQVIVVGDPASMASEVDDVILTPVEDIDVASRFVQLAYEEIFEYRPDLKAILCVASTEELEQCQRIGHMYWIGDEAHGRCGLLATEHVSGVYVEGQCVIEEIVARPWQGRSMASRAQRALASVLVGSGTLIWGTIDGQNVPSRRAAMRAGRQEVAAWYWLRP